MLLIAITSLWNPEVIENFQKLISAEIKKILAPRVLKPRFR